MQILNYQVIVKHSQRILSIISHHMYMCVCMVCVCISMSVHVELAYY